MGADLGKDRSRPIVLDEDKNDNASCFTNIPQVLLTTQAKEPGSDDVLTTLQTRVVSGEGDGFDYRFVSGCNVSFIGQKNEYSCTYCSLMMIVSSLLSSSAVYRREIFAGFNAIPDVPSIQRLLESAWAAGYDLEGSTYFNRSVLGKRVRIGPTDVAAVMRANKVPTCIYDFDYGRDSFDSLLLFVTDYFFNAEEAAIRMPLLLGTADHTVVVVGCRMHKDRQSVEIIVLDPIMRSSASWDSKSLSDFILPKVSERQFQVLSFGPHHDNPGLLLAETSPAKYGARVLMSVRPPRATNDSSSSKRLRV